MPIPNSYLLKVLAWWPTNNNDGWDLSVPSPWQNISISGSPDPLSPQISIRFTHAIDPNIYQNDSNVAQYFFLTSQTHPGSTNVTNFKNVSWNSALNILSFSPYSSLTAGDTYTAFLSDKLPDAAGRLLDRSYTWTFDVDNFAYTGVPVPISISPPDQTAVSTDIPSFTWGLPKTYSIPSGSTLNFRLTISANKEMTQVIWGHDYPASSLSSGAASDPLNKLYQVTPAISSQSLANKTLYWWTVQSFLTNASGSVVSDSGLSSLFYFYVDVPAVGIDAETYPLLTQTPQVNSPNQFYVSGVFPSPGYAIPMGNVP